MQKIKKAILPVAGFGTRFLPATKAMPKEMLPVVDKPAIQYLVEDAVKSGIEEIIFVTGRGKTSIEDHFDHSFELEHNLVERNKHDLLKEVRKISRLAKFTYVRQPLPLGDGHAINCAAHLIGQEPVLIMFGDSLYDAKVPTAKQLIQVFNKYNDPVIGLSPVPKEEVYRFGVIDGIQINKDIYEIKRIVEKPKMEDAPSNLVAVGLYIITPEILRIINKIKQDKTGEVRLADAFDILLKKNRPVYGKVLEGLWLDTGDKFNLIRTTIHLGLKNKEVGFKLKKYIKEISKKL